MQKQPTFTVSARAIGMIADISAHVERYAIRMEQQDALRLRKINKIKTIHSSLAIEGNTLTESQVTDILNGKKVVAPLREIQEVKNAIATYDIAHKLNPFSVKDMLKAHGVMMSALVEEAGVFRSSKVGVFAGKRATHIAPPPKQVPALMGDLFDWLKKAEDHLLIRSCVFHYQFEFIHPFTDGNGRIGRLWQSLILGKLNPIFLQLPVESMVHDNQQQYYKAISESTKNADSGRFIDFMLN
ncbi:MAG: Fic family protein, partial [Thermoguttaceae bacterium]